MHQYFESVINLCSSGLNEIHLLGISSSTYFLEFRLNITVTID